MPLHEIILREGRDGMPLWVSTCGFSTCLSEWYFDSESDAEAGWKAHWAECHAADYDEEE